MAEDVRMRDVFAQRRRSVRLMAQGGGVHAEAVADGAGTVREDVAQVGVAAGAAHLGAHHPVRAVLDVADGAGQRLVEAGPAAV